MTMKTCLTVELSPDSSLRHQPELLGYFESSSSSPTAVTRTDDGGSCCTNDESTFIIHAKRVSLSHTVLPEQEQQQSAHSHEATAALPLHHRGGFGSLHPLAAVFVSSTITESALDDFKHVKRAAAQASSSRKSNNSTDDDDEDDFIVSDPLTRQRLSQRLLSLVHSFLARNFSVKGIVSHSKRRPPQNNDNHSHWQELPKQHAPSDIILLDLSHAPAAAIDDLLQATNGQLVHSGPEAILKVLLISQLVLTIASSSDGESGNQADEQQKLQQPEVKNHKDNLADSGATLEEPSSRTCWDIPTCPVCLHRIDPRRLGLPRPENHQLCSKFCPPPNYSAGFQQYHYHGNDYNHGDGDDNYSNYGWNTRHHHDHRVSLDSASLTAAAAASALPCSRQRLLQPWPSPSYCIACRVIDKYWKLSSSSSTTEGVAAAAAGRRTGLAGDDDGDSSSSSAADAVKNNHRQGIFCFQCSLQETLWVCLTCGFVGCGRYSNKHAAQHFVDTGHPYSLELATLRIWDYVAGDFATRTDLLECPSSPPLMHPWMNMGGMSGSSRVLNNSFHHPATVNESVIHRIGNTDDRKPAASSASDGTSWGGAGPSGNGNMNGNNASLSHQHLLHAAYNDGRSGSSWGGVGGFFSGEMSSESKTPKKATMIGEEYEALLQSALEDQAQHYEGEIIHLRARLTAENVDQSSMTADEGREIECLQSEIANVRSEIERVSRELLDSQAQEAGHRATSQRLLREQQVVQELLLKIRTETTKEHEEGQLQVEELEQQIADLTANQRMRDQFSQDEELQQAQIWGTANSTNNDSSNNNKSAKKSSGKKTRRFFRK